MTNTQCAAAEDVHGTAALSSWRKGPTACSIGRSKGQSNLQQLCSLCGAWLKLYWCHSHP
jgi:hypothetical protein